MSDGKGFIRLRGVEVHNLKAVDLDIPHRKLVVFCGLSGSGKTSLALDTLYAEGQRRYIETFSAYTRQFFERLEKPAAELIAGIPPAIAVTHRGSNRSSRATVGTATEAYDYLRLLMAKIGQVFCRNCGQRVRSESPESTAAAIAPLPAGTRFMLAFAPGDRGQGTGVREEGQSHDEVAAVFAGLREEGFVRVVLDGRTIDLNDSAAVELTAGNAPPHPQPLSSEGRGEPETPTLGSSPSSLVPRPRSTELAEVSPLAPLLVIVDRLAAGSTTPQRIRESIEAAFANGDGTCHVLIDSTERPDLPAGPRGAAFELDGRAWWQLTFSRTLRCDDCGNEYPQPEPRLFSFNSPLGACPECEGFGNVIDIDMDLIVPDPNKSIRDGAIAPWNTPAYAHELKELIALADEYGVPLDVPFRTLADEQLRTIREGVAERNFGGLRGFFAWLERRKYKMHLRVYLSRWRSYRPCPTCGGTRLRPEALATRIGGLNIAELSTLKIRDALDFFAKLELSDHERRVGRMMLEQVQSRMGYLDAVGLGYLSLDRTLRTLSGGESQRVALTSALGSSLVNMLYVLDEPSIGLHPADVDRLLASVVALRDRGNSVLVVEHEETMLRSADQIIEIGRRGERGGKIVFQDRD